METPLPLILAHVREQVDAERSRSRHPTEISDLLDSEHSELALAMESALRGSITVGDCLGRYRTTDRLGSGGMGQVFSVESLDARRSRPLALKLMHPRLIDSPRARRRFERELSLGREIAHPGVPRVVDWGTTQLPFGEAPWVVMERIAGVTLRDVLKHHGALGRDAAIRIARDLASALSALHRAGAVHRDVKPENVLIGTRGLGHLLDLGVAWALEDAEVSESGDILGSIPYAAPEQLRRGNRQPDGRTDVFGLAVTLFEALSARLPWPAALETSVAARTWIPPLRVSDVVPIDRALSDLMTRMLSMRAADRPDMPATAAELDRLCEAPAAVVAPVVDPRLLTLWPRVVTAVHEGARMVVVADADRWMADEIADMLATSDRLRCERILDESRGETDDRRVFVVYARTHEAAGHAVGQFLRTESDAVLVLVHAGRTLPPTIEDLATRPDAHVLALACDADPSEEIARLAAEDRSLLRIAASLGQSFRADQLAQILGEDEYNILRALMRIGRETGLLRNEDDTFRLASKDESM